MSKREKKSEQEARDQERHSWLDGPANDYGRDERLFALMDTLSQMDRKGGGE
jgi:hypothetical protein